MLIRWTLFQGLENHLLSEILTQSDAICEMLS